MVFVPDWTNKNTALPILLYFNTLQDSLRQSVFLNHIYHLM